jgi:hypothetical protein
MKEWGGILKFFMTQTNNKKLCAGREQFVISVPNWRKELVLKKVAFYVFLVAFLLMNRPLPAQLPGGDGGSHKDKPKVEIDKSTEVVMGNTAHIRLEVAELVFKNNEGITVSEYIADNDDARINAVQKREEKGFKLAETKKLKNPRVSFYDKSGDIIKEIQINRWERKIFPKIEQDAKAKEPLDTFWQIEESAEVSPDGGHVFIQTQTREGTLKYMEASHPKAEWKIFDYSGTQLWKKKGDDIAMRGAVSDAGSLIVILGGDREGGGDEKLKVYDKAGAEAFSYPDPEDKVVQIYTDRFSVSPNGRYLAIRVTFEDYKDRTVFFDLKTKKFWKSEREYVVYSVTNFGLVECYFYDEEKQERSITKFIDIKPYFKD